MSFKFYTIYKTTNIINNKIYIGQHQTQNLDDGYLGSGTLLLKAFNKHGKENFKKEILHTFNTFKEMDDKEKELVDEEFLKRPDVYNMVVGGLGSGAATLCINKVVIIDEHFGGFTQINCEDYDPKIHRTINTGKISIKDGNGYKQINSNEYDPKIHKTASHGIVSIECLTTGKTSSIKKELFDSSIHKKVFGGIVVNGKYVSKEEYYSNPELKIHTAGHVTIKLDSGECKRIPVEDFDPLVHKTPTSDLVNCIEILTNKNIQLTKKEYLNNKHLYKTHTSGKRTVYEISSKKFININKEDFDSELYKTPSDKLIKCYDENNNLILTFWGSKKDFYKLHCNSDYNEKLWKCVISGEKYKVYTNKGIVKDPQFDKCYFITKSLKEL